MESEARRFVAGGYFGKDSWENVKIALTNTAMFLYNKEKLASSAPEIVWIHELSFDTDAKNYKL